MKVIECKRVWVIMSKDRKFIAKGTPRNRHLIKVGSNDAKRYLTYSSKGKAESGFTRSGFYGEEQLEKYKYGDKLSKHLEAVECEMTITMI